MAEEQAKDVVYFARTDFRGTNRLFGIKRSDRRQHMYVIGKSGTGKTTLIKNMVIQDIVNGEGLCVVDPHGEFVEEVLEKIPENRIDDVIYFNPADTDYHIGFNVLELPDPKYKHLVASGLMSIFTKIWSGVWSARMEYIMNNAILALLDYPGSSLLGITRILVDKEYRQKVIANCQDPVVKAFWISEYEEWKDQFRNEAIAPIQNKVGQFLSSAMIRNIVGQSKSTIDIFDIMNSGKIFLVNVSKGRVGEDNSALLGAMIITKIQLSAMERVRIPESERTDFYLYVDEFQNFATDSFASILSEARKYRLNLILAHQYIGQLVTDSSTRVRDAVFGNVGTMVSYRVGAADAEFLEKEFEPEFTIQDIVNLPNYTCYLKLLVNGVASRPFSARILPPLRGSATIAPVDDIIQHSRKKYARPRYIVEEEIKKWSGMSLGEGAQDRRREGVEEQRFDRPARKEDTSRFDALAKLGIEFLPSSEAQRPSRPPESRPPMHTRPHSGGQSASRPQAMHDVRRPGARVSPSQGAYPPRRDSRPPFQQGQRGAPRQTGGAIPEELKKPVYNPPLTKKTPHVEHLGEGMSLSALKPVEKKVREEKTTASSEVEKLKSSISDALSGYTGPASEKHGKEDGKKEE